MQNKIFRVLIATSNPYIPQLMGGSERSSQAIGKHLESQGYTVDVICGLKPNDLIGLSNRIRRKLLKIRFPRDQLDGMSIYRVWPDSGSIAQHIKEFISFRRPDIALVQAGHPFSIARQFHQEGIPTIVFLRDLLFPESDGKPPTGKTIKYIANSKYTAERFAKQFGIQATAVIPPSINPDDYRVVRSGRYALMINPVTEKGIDLTLELASRLPDIPFVLQESWEINEKTKSKIETATKQLKNIKLQPKCHDMKPVYSGARVLLAPSQWEEAWGRVASEAQVNGIPVIASNIGGLPEAVGEGGALLPPNDIDQWEATLRTVWENSQLEESLSKLALLHSQREDIQHDFLLKKTQTIIDGLLERK